MEFIFLLVLFMVNRCAGKFASPNDVVGRSSTEIGWAMENCVEILYPGSGYNKIFPLFWNPKYPLDDENFGCLFLCGLFKLHLLQRNGNLDEENLKKFLVIKNADIHTARKLSDTLRSCYHPNPKSKETCIIGLRFLKCLRSALNTTELMPPIIL